MKIAKKTQRKEFKNGNYCTAYEYPLGDAAINVALIVITGRYPEKGQAQNLSSKELAYVIRGKGSIAVGAHEFAIEEGDMVLIDPGEKFFWNGDMELFMPCTPAWTPEQYRIAE